VIKKERKMTSMKVKLKNKELLIGSWLTLGQSSIAEIMAQAGFEWLAVDMEHSVITLDRAQALIQAIELSGCIPLVRVGENDPTVIKRVMDAGAHGVIVPMINSKEDAIRAVNAVKYPPVGTRGVGLARAQKYGYGFDEYKKWVAQESIVIAQIEHIKAIEALEEIIGVQGIDGTIIGPYDLSASLGLPGEFDNKRVVAALKRYEDICRMNKKPMGFHAVQPDALLANSYIEKGYTFLAVGVDMLYLGNKCRETLSGIKI
jgi:2-keto-3-deoxy-L-rhamnonate aldolase RhmA